ncbi:GNAT family N-acetyltransferase [Actinophytocola sp. NPDC049390]|uniref:GNAT family N-acetyltransferase n=1 Tax=Actinophytocola sp. NPDC049390 TaxID=3363894 RepID=UPI00378C0B85
MTTDLACPGDLPDGTVRLRPWTPDDVACVEEAATDRRIVEATTVPGQYTPAEGLAFIHRQHGRLVSGQGVSLAIADHRTGEARGLVILQLRPQPGVAGLGYGLVPSARRHGLARRAVGLMTEWGLGTFARIEAWVEPDNEASQRVLAANGFQQEGLLRSFLAFGSRRADVLVYARIRDAPGLRE